MTEAPTAPATTWRQIEIELTAALVHPDPYATVEVWADFRSAGGELLRRPAFWDGGGTWRIRFAPTSPGSGPGPPARRSSIPGWPTGPASS